MECQQTRTPKCICGLLRFDGSITVNGYENRSIEAKHILGYIPECPAIYPMLTVWEHLEFIARAYELDAAWESFAHDLPARFELDDKKIIEISIILSING